MATEILNGVRNNYGPQSSENLLPGENKTFGNVKSMIIDFAWDDLPTYSADGSRVREIPADSLIVGAKIHAGVAMSGTSGTFIIGLYESDSTVIDADGLFQVGETTQAALTEDAWLIGSAGELLPNVSIGAAAGQVVVAGGGTITGGEFRLIVDYIEPTPAT